MKMFNKYIGKITLVFALVFSVASCDFYDLDINDDPNNPTEGDLDLLLSSIQVDMAYTYQGFNNTTQGTMGLTGNFDGNDMQQNSFNGRWNGLYRGQLKDLDEYIKLAEASVTEDGTLLLPVHLGIGQTIKAFWFSTMVDVWGDIPFTEAGGGNADDPIFSPVYDDQEDIYLACIALLDAAITNLAGTQPKVTGDIIYGGSGSDWSRAAQTLKLRLLMQASKAPGWSVGADVADLINNGDLIDNYSDDFQFRYTTNNDRGERHPWMGSVYTGDNSFSYMMHQFMYEMLINGDPRMNYYFNRQTSNTLDQNDDTQKNTTPCSQNTFCFYNYMVLNGTLLQTLSDAGILQDPPSVDNLAYMAGLFGRDKGDPSGIPLDGSLRTAPGVFPMGGAYDPGTVDTPGSPATLTASKGIGLGDGITVFASSLNTKMYRIEAALAGYTAEDPRVLLEEFVRESMAKVESFSMSVAASGSVAMDPTAVDTYVTNVLADYDAAGNKLSVAMKQAWFAYFGIGGMELYNGFRRTGFPDDIQIPTYFVSSTGQRQFPIRWPYVITEITLNDNLSAVIPSDGTEGIFWDVIKYKY